MTGWAYSNSYFQIIILFTRVKIKIKLAKARVSHVGSYLFMIPSKCRSSRSKGSVTRPPPSSSSVSPCGGRGYYRHG